MERKRSKMDRVSKFKSLKAQEHVIYLLGLALGRSGALGCSLALGYCDR